MGPSQNPTADQFKKLEKAGQMTLLDSLKLVKVTNGTVVFSMTLPRQGVLLLQVNMVISCVFSNYFNCTSKYTECRP